MPNFCIINFKHPKIHAKSPENRHQQNNLIEMKTLLLEHDLICQLACIIDFLINYLV